MLGSYTGTSTQLSVTELRRKNASVVLPGLFTLTCSVSKQSVNITVTYFQPTSNQTLYKYVHTLLCSVLSYPLSEYPPSPFVMKGKWKVRRKKKKFCLRFQSYSVQGRSQCPIDFDLKTKQNKISSLPFICYQESQRDNSFLTCSTEIV